MSGERTRLFTVRLRTKGAPEGVQRRGHVRDVSTGAFRSFRNWSRLTTSVAERFTLGDRATGRQGSRTASRARLVAPTPPSAPTEELIDP